MKSLNEDLKTGKFKQIYLLFGQEAYLKKQYKERFVKAMVPEGDTMNYSSYEGKKTDIKEVIDLAETLPFFSERRLIVFEDTGFFKNGGNDLADYIKKESETPEGVWGTNIFGKTVEELVMDGMKNKIAMIGDESQMKLQDSESTMNTEALKAWKQATSSPISIATSNLILVPCMHHPRRKHRSRK